MSEPSWIFAQNSTCPSPCPHAQIGLLNDDVPTLSCRACGKRWTFVPAGESPRYYAEDDPSCPGMLDSWGWAKSMHVTIMGAAVGARASKPSAARRWSSSNGGNAWFWSDDRADFGFVFKKDDGRYGASTCRGSATFEDLTAAKNFVEEHSS
jgi:hypothetical protein